MLALLYHQRTVEVLLTLALLLKQVIATVALHGNFSATGLANSLLRAAV